MNLLREKFLCARSDQRKEILKLHKETRESSQLTFSIEKVAGQKSSTVVPCKVVEPVTLVHLKWKKVCD